MESYLLLWVIHVLGWFVLGALSSLLRGQWNTLKLTSCAAMGTMSALLHLLIRYYLAKS